MTLGCELPRALATALLATTGLGERNPSAQSVRGKDERANNQNQQDGAGRDRTKEQPGEESLVVQAEIITGAREPR